MRRGALILASACLFLAPMPAAAEPTSAAFLKIPVGARAVAMGGAYTALAEGADALYWNPAGVASLSGKQLGTTHAELFAGMRYDFLGYVQPTSVGSIGTSMALLSQGGIEGRGENREPTGGFGASDAAFSLAYGRNLSRIPARVGLSVKYLESRIGADAARSYALDLGTLYRLPAQAPLSLGLAARNIGPGMRFQSERFPSPLTLAAGLAYRLPAGLALAVDVQHKPYEGKTALGIGTEYAVLSALSVRAGYSGLGARSEGSSSALSGVQGLGAGLGIRISRYQFDYAFTPFGELGNAQGVSLNARW